MTKGLFRIRPGNGENTKSLQFGSKQRNGEMPPILRWIKKGGKKVQSMFEFFVETVGIVVITADRLLETLFCVG